MVKRKSNYVEFIYCGCGCGFTRPKYNHQNNQLRNYINGHQVRGKKYSDDVNSRKASKGKTNPRYGIKLSEELKQRISRSLKGRKLPEEVLKKLRSKNVGYSGVHKRVKQRFVKPELCMLCNKLKARELACITSIYNDELRNWAWFCVSCHRKWDNNGIRRRLKNRSVFSRIVIFYIRNLDIIILLQYR